MSMLSQAVKGVGKVVTAPLHSLQNLVTGKFNIGDIITLGSLFAPGGSLLNLGKSGLGALGTANLGANLGTQGLLNSAGLGGFTSGGGKIDWIKGLGQMAGVDIQKLMSGHGSINDYVGALQAIGVKSPELAKLGAASGIDFEKLLNGHGTVTDYINAIGTIGQIAGGGGTAGKAGDTSGTVGPGFLGNSTSAGTAGFDPKNPVDSMQSLIASLYPSAQSGINFLNEMTPVKQNIIRAGVSELDPSRNVAAAQSANSLGQAAAERVNSQNQSKLLSQGVSLAEIQGLAADNMNRATDQGNSYYHAAMNPQVIGQQRKDQLSLLSDQELEGQVNSLYNKLLALKQVNQQDAATKASQPSTLNTLLGLAGQYVGSGGLDNIFGGGKTNTGTNTETYPSSSTHYQSTLPTSMDLGHYNPLDHLPTKIKLAGAA